MCVNRRSIVVDGLLLLLLLAVMTLLQTCAAVDGDQHNDGASSVAGSSELAVNAGGGSVSNHRWTRTEAMDANGLYVLDWRVHGRQIYFRITANTRGFVGLGFSQKSGRMADADLVMAWVDDRTGKPTVLVGSRDRPDRTANNRKP